jgi:RNA polymerase sigma-70 factor (ECF subfamily)
MGIICVESADFQSREIPVSSPANSIASDALGSMYTLHNRWLTAWLQRKLGNRHDAADIAQDTFTRIWATAKSQAIEDIREPKAYLTTVARRLMINHLERRSLEQAYLASLHLLPEETALSAEARAILLETLEELDHCSASCRPKFALHFCFPSWKGSLTKRLHRICN